MPSFSITAYFLRDYLADMLYSSQRKHSLALYATNPEQNREDTSRGDFKNPIVKTTAKDEIE